jgi:hypothetical protein
MQAEKRGKSWWQYGKAEPAASLPDFTQASVVSPLFSGYMNIRLAHKQVHIKCTENQLQVIRKSIENVVKSVMVWEHEG